MLHVAAGRGVDRRPLDRHHVDALVGVPSPRGAPRVHERGAGHRARDAAAARGWRATPSTAAVVAGVGRRSVVRRRGSRCGERGRLAPSRLLGRPTLALDLLQSGQFGLEIVLAGLEVGDRIGLVGLQCLEVGRGRGQVLPGALVGIEGVGVAVGDDASQGVGPGQTGQVPAQQVHVRRPDVLLDGDLLHLAPEPTDRLPGHVGLVLGRADVLADLAQAGLGVGQVLGRGRGSGPDLGDVVTRGRRRGDGRQSARHQGDDQQQRERTQGPPCYATPP